MKRERFQIILNEFGTQCYHLNKEKDSEYKLIEFLRHAIPLILDSSDYELILDGLTKIAKEAREEVELEESKV